MGLLDKVKDISKEISEKNDEYYTKQREKREAKQQAKQEKREAKLRKKQEEDAKKIKNPRLIVNNGPGTVVVNDDRLIIGTFGRSYDILYSDIKSLNMRGHILEIKTISEDFKVKPHLGYNAATHALFNQIRKKRTESNQPTVVVNEKSSTDELEKIVKMYQDGLLTDDEFASMKQKIIEK